MDAQALERELANDLQTLGDLIHDDSIYPELYRALAGTTWRRGGDGHVALSWKRAEELLNQVRAHHDLPALALAQTGGEGEVSTRVARALEGLDWTPGPPAEGHDDAHIDSPKDAPARGAAAPPEWERRAQAEADANER
jgi:hypothetical protein